ncbi:Eukaryotic translation initiation factor 4B [Cladophialophora chaetospira]|uniref:Eukaryotic translation initiation factor 4B n=1 Tax=Cladophialophora chaetospira TaxID=386627 RepID=A0AA39CKX4_9EURO|nr:Eukaryotic translation initiation factor 4B [Cladophialophora chaetospira]
MPPKKNQKMSLGTFLQDENYGSWADEMEDMPLPTPADVLVKKQHPTIDPATDQTDEDLAQPPEWAMAINQVRTLRNYDASEIADTEAWTERRADGYSVREELPLPTQPPYTAHLANLSFDARQEDVNDFFKDCQVTNVRIVEDKLDRKPKGFGYVEFATLDGLKAALALSGENLAGRQVRISVAEPPKERQDTRDFSDWSRKGPLPDLPNQRRVSDRPAGGFGGRSFTNDNMSDAGSERGNRRGYGGDDSKVRDFGNWERRGPLSPATPGPTSLREGGRQGSKDGYNMRKNSPSWGEGRSQDGSRPPRREFTERPPPERQPTAPELDNQWRSRMRPDAPKVPTPEASEPSSPAPPSAPATRPKLNLQKRTVSESDPVASPAQISDAKASPFGAARPVDTAAKEKEVEEKRQLAIRQKKEADEKAKTEKAEEKRLAREKADSEREKAKETGSKESKESNEAKEVDEINEKDEESAQPAPKFDILRRADSGMNDMIADDEVDEAEEQVQPTDDKAVKPKEIVRTPTAGKANGSWRNGPAKQPAAEKSTANELEEDGWSTVSKPKKQGNRRHGGPARAAAS